MKFILLSFIFFFVWISDAWAQSTQETNGNVYNNNNSLNNSLNMGTSNEELLLDTTSLDLKETESEEEKLESIDKKNVKKAPTRSAEKAVMESPAAPTSVQPASTSSEFYGVSSAESADELKSVQSGAYQQATYEFSMSKQEATVQRQQRSPSYEQQVEMNDAVSYFENNAPNSFEYHYFTYLAGNYNVDLVDHLFQAEKLKPNNTDVHVQLAGYHMISRDTDSAVIYLNKLIDEGRITQSTLQYAEDILLSVPQNGVLITHGFDDSYGVWTKQLKDGVRSDVQLISLDFLQSGQFRALLKEDGFVLPQRTLIDVTYLKEFCELNPRKEIGISLTTPKEYFQPIQSKLYVTGLVFEYHNEEFNNFERNDALWNQTLKKYVVENASDEKSKQLSSNYLPMLLQLRKVYEQQNNTEKLKDVDAATDAVGIQCKKYEQVQKLKSSY